MNVFGTGQFSEPVSFPIGIFASTFGCDLLNEGIREDVV